MSYLDKGTHSKQTCSVRSIYVGCHQSEVHNNMYQSVVCDKCVINVPQIDDSLHKWISQSKSALSECPYPDRTLPMAYAIYCHTPTCCNAEAAFNIHWPTDIQYAIWLCGKPVAASKTNTMLFYLVHWDMLVPERQSCVSWGNGMYCIAVA